MSDRFHRPPKQPELNEFKARPDTPTHGPFWFWHDFPEMRKES